MLCPVLLMCACCLLQAAACAGQGSQQQQQQHELRVLSLEPASLGQILACAPVQAAHCITSIQFSPCSRHLLVAYGRCRPPNLTLTSGCMPGLSAASDLPVKYSRGG